MQSCKTCKWSRWWLTPTGRIKKDNAGRCVVPLPIVVLPACVTEAYGFPKEWHRQFVTENMGGKCPLWEENAGKPISESL